MQHPDQKYIDAFIDDDATLLKEVYQKYFSVKAMVMKNNGSEADARDLFQDALYSIMYRAKTRGYTLTCPFDSFLKLVCKRKWLNELRKRNRVGMVRTFDVEGYNDMGEDSIKQAERFMIAEERNALLKEKLAEIGESCRKLLLLCWSELSLDEVAEKLEITYGYLCVKRFKCIKRLITLIKQASQFKDLNW